MTPQPEIRDCTVQVTVATWMVGDPTRENWGDVALSIARFAVSRDLRYEGLDGWDLVDGGKDRAGQKLLTVDVYMFPRDAASAAPPPLLDATALEQRARDMAPAILISILEGVVCHE